MGKRKAPQGRRTSIPKSLFVTVSRLSDEGLGSRCITRELDALGVATSRGSVYRLLKGISPYRDALESLDEKPSTMETTL